MPDPLRQLAETSLGTGTGASSVLGAAGETALNTEAGAGIIDLLRLLRGRSESEKQALLNRYTGTPAAVAPAPGPGPGPLDLLQKIRPPVTGPPPNMRAVTGTRGSGYLPASDPLPPGVRYR